MMQSERLTGTRKLVSCEARGSNGEVVYSYGRDQLGMLMYNLKGNMSALLMRRNRPKSASGDLRRGAPEEKKPPWKDSTPTAEAMKLTKIRERSRSI